MEIFGKYADFYDAYYAGKNYDAEVEFALKLASIHSIIPEHVLDIGCGTGGHVISFAKRGVKVHGFDLSEKMIGIARQKIVSSNVEGKADVSVGSAAAYRDGKTYELVVSMFAVMGYLITNEDFLSGIRTAQAHLRKDGLFIFDVWFGPAVLSKQPSTRVQEFTQEGKQVIRIVRPHLDIVKQIVTVQYDLMKYEGDHIIEIVNETHHMRYFFVQELKFFLKQAGLELISAHPFLVEGKEPTVDDWNISVVARKG